MKKLKIRADIHSFNRRKLWYAILENAGLLLLLLLIFTPAYETNDDMGMALLVNGAKGVYDPHLVFSHYFLGVVLSVLYRLTDRIPWYPLLQYLTLFASFTAVTYVCNRKTADWLQRLLWMAVFAYEGYINLQFTKTAGIASAAGIFLIFHAIEGESVQKKALIFGVIIACVGSMYRKNQFFAEGFLMTGIGIYQLLLLGKEKGKRLKKLLLYIGTFFVLLVCVTGLRKIDQTVYETNEEWQEYRVYNKLRGKLYDYGFPSYQNKKKLYRKYGINKAAYNLYRSWAHMDPEYFTIDLMEALYEKQPKKTVNLEFFQEYLTVFPVSFLKIPVCCSVFLPFGLWLLFGKKKWQQAAAVIYELLAVMLIYLYLYYRGRYLLNRVDVGLWFAVVLLLFWYDWQIQKKAAKRFCVGIVFLMLLWYQKNWQQCYRWNQEEKLTQQSAERAVIETIAADQEHLYLTKPTIVSFAKAYGVFDYIPFGIAKNIYSLGGWSSATPVYSKVLEQFEIQNPFRDMIGNEKVYLIDHKLELTMDYIQSYYDENARAVCVFTYAPYQVYQILSES